MKSKKDPDQKKLKHTSIKIEDEQQVLEEFTELLTHKLRNPLGGIKGFASLLERDLKDSPHLQKMAGMIVEGTNNIDNILSSLTLYASPIKLKCEEVDFGKYLEEFFNKIKIPSTINLSIKIPQEPIFVSIDKSSLQNSLSILFANALGSTRSKGCITILFKAKDNQAILSISDNGEGIPEHQQKNAFSPFFLPPYGGSEGGLATVRKIIHAHGGAIELISNYRNKNTFNVYLPLKTGFN